MCLSLLFMVVYITNSWPAVFSKFVAFHFVQFRYGFICGNSLFSSSTRGSHIPVTAGVCRYCKCSAGRTWTCFYGCFVCTSHEIQKFNSISWRVVIFFPACFSEICAKCGRSLHWLQPKLSQKLEWGFQTTVQKLQKHTWQPFPINSALCSVSLKSKICTLLRSFLALGQGWPSHGWRLEDEWVDSASVVGQSSNEAS